MAENEIGVTVNSQTTSLTQNSQITSLLGNSSEESPTLCPQLALTGHSIVVASLLTMFISLAIFGNALVILSVLWNRQLQTATNLFICNLAVADLLISVCVLPFSATLEVLGCWPFGRVFCDTWAAVDVLCCTASILSLCAIAVDRYIGVRHSLHYRFLVTRRRAGVVLACVWTVCGALSAPPLLGWKEARSPDINICTVTQEPGYALFSSLLSFYLPLGVVLAVYTQVYVVARRTTLCLERGMKRERHPPGGAAEVVLRIHRRGAVLGEDISGGARRMHSRVLQRFAREKKAAKTLAMVVGVFVFCWLPFFIVLPLGAMFPMLKPTETVFKVVFWLGYFNSCINPFIYPCSNREFRQAFMKLLRVPTISWSSNGPLGGSVGNNQKVINTNPTQIPPLRNSMSQQITCFHLNIRWWSLFRRGSLWLQELMDSQTSKVRQGSHQQSTHNSTGNLNSVSMEISSMSTN